MADAKAPLFNSTSIKGTYGYLGQAFADNFRPTAAIGRVTFDGKGNLVGFYKAIEQGVLSGKVTYKGTYTVDADGTGQTIIKIGGGGGSYSNDFVIVDGGREIFGYETMKERIATVVFKKQ
ncbi:MAG: hypothetical protein WBP93_13600 [Pyrinomonadaceae bacterium]